MSRPDPLHPQLCPCQRCRHPGPGQRARRFDRLIVDVAAGAAILTLFLIVALKGS